MLKFYWENGVRDHWPTLAMIVCIAALAPFFQIANLGMVVPIVTLLMGEPSDLQSLNLPLLHRFVDGFLQFSKMQVLVALITIMAALLIVKNVLTIVRCYATIRVLTSVRFSLTKRMLYRYLKAHYEKQSTHASGVILHQVWEPPIHVAETIRAGSEILANAFQFLALAILMAWISWKLTLLTTIWAAVSVLLFDRIFRRPLNAISDESFVVANRTMAFLSDVMAGVRQVKAHVAESQVMSRLARLLHEFDHQEAKHARLKYLPGPFHELFLACLVTFLVVTATLVPQLRIEFSYLVAFLLALVRLGPTINGLTEAQVSLHTARKSVEVSRTFIETWTAEEDSGRLMPPARISELKFNQVSFSYQSRPKAPVLLQASISFRVNEITALVGPSGAGKSTMADLIIRLYTPLAGTIEADRIDIRGFNLAAWRRQVGFVSQDTFLFNASIRENIALSNPTVSLDDVKAAARLAHIHDFIESLPDGYETVVGDRGVKLSGGQRQRIAIARALLTGPQVLIFDEATSALDNLSERAIQETINELRDGRIVIVVAHRLSTIVHADRIVVLEEGRVIEEGSHAELMERGASYAQLYAVLDQG